ncbi:hypothetical protein I551_8931 [Mycobacterium ulcerans str. Harvey]|uniref:Uncharacterized protein n=1 Tax=Mycobacterium ulcerans str. Harvey TaxID=1299332 RepID=A0ABN0R9P4_MYCUL|nr:hypothetical protein I551_8931 [Mycobacterium ulcerans str. Harvey]
MGAGLAIADDCSNGVRIARKSLQQRRPTWNVAAEAGDLDGQKTVVVCAHHDAATAESSLSGLSTLLCRAVPGDRRAHHTSSEIWCLSSWRRSSPVSVLARLPETMIALAQP